MGRDFEEATGRKGNKNFFTNNSKFHSKWQTELAVRRENVSFSLPNT